jgi:hypothetical protein
MEIFFLGVALDEEILNPNGFSFIVGHFKALQKCLD